MSVVTQEMVRTIAAMLDHPNVYMGGPSQRNMRRAEQIIAAAAPIIAKAERERCAVWHDEQAAGEDALAKLALGRDDEDFQRHRHIAREHVNSAAAIRALGDAT